MNTNSIDCAKNRKRLARKRKYLPTGRKNLCITESVQITAPVPAAMVTNLNFLSIL
jgi:hypothetical protein